MLPDGSADKQSACNAEDTGDSGLIPGSGRSPGGGKWQPTQSGPTLYKTSSGAHQAPPSTGIFQMRMLELVAVSFFRESS